jgi:hypothetical protein
MIPQNNTPRPSRSFGSVQETFRYRISNFNSGEQFTIVEDMPRSKPVRLETKRMAGEKNGRKYDFDAETYLIKVVSRGYEADIELKPKELMVVATLCPKGLENFKGATFVFDGYNWSFMGIETPHTPISNIGQAMRDPRQPDLNPAPDQRDLYTQKLTNSIQTLSEYGNKMDSAAVMSICEKITPGKAMDLFAYAKGKGTISETNGEWKAN